MVSEDLIVPYAVHLWCFNGVFPSFLELDSHSQYKMSMYGKEMCELHFYSTEERKSTGWNDTRLSKWRQVSFCIFSVMSPWKTFLCFQFEISAPLVSLHRKKNHADLIRKLPEIVWTWVVFLSCNRGLLLERSGAGPLWHNYSRSIWSNLHKRRRSSIQSLAFGWEM